MSVRDDLIFAISLGRDGHLFWEERAADAVLALLREGEWHDGAVERGLDNWWTQESVRLGLSTVNAEHVADWKARHRDGMSSLLRAAVGGERQ
jgi:hypothetical protein